MLKVTTYIAGEGWFLRLLEDVYHTLANAGENAELLVHAADDSESPPKVIAKYREIRRAGIRMRQTVEAGNTYLMGPLEEDRYIPKPYFKNWVKLIYGGKVAISRANETGCMVIVDEERAAAMCTLIETARLNGLDPERYLRAVIACIGDHPINRIDELRPWNITL